MLYIFFRTAGITGSGQVSDLSTQSQSPSTEQVNGSRSSTSTLVIAGSMNVLEQDIKHHARKNNSRFLQCHLMIPSRAAILLIVDVEVIHFARNTFDGKSDKLDRSNGRT